MPLCLGMDLVMDLPVVFVGPIKVANEPNSIIITVKDSIKLPGPRQFDCRLGLQKQIV